MLFLLHHYLDIPPRSRSSLCGTRRRWEHSKWPFPKRPHSPRQAVYLELRTLCQRQCMGQTTGLVSHSGNTLLLPVKPQNDQPFPMFCYARATAGSDKAGMSFLPLECQITISMVWILQTWKIGPLAKGTYILLLMVTIRMTRPDSSITAL